MIKPTKYPVGVVLLLPLALLQAAAALAQGEFKKSV